MQEFVLLAQPWWVNLFILIPIVVYWFFRKTGFGITRNQLMIAALFGIAFGFIESSVVVYLRAALGFLSELSAKTYLQPELLGNLPKSLFRVEFFREASTLIMLMSLAFLTARSTKARLAIFLWTFAFWDIFYFS
ncbi:MAG: hypothetical protein KW788_04935, partial [Candidatus Doudnabacteria bacterium]|nr:hypothetical protein [Candidatus Doudnabacteria bacterium]